MKHLSTAPTVKSLAIFLVISFFNVIVMAQDSSVSSTHTTTTTEAHTWYAQPWVWFVGGAVLLLILIALIRSNSSGSGSGRTDKVTYTKTTETDKP